VQGPKYRQEHVAVFCFSCTNRKSSKNASVRLLFCHTSENMVYSLILNIAATVEKTHKPQWRMNQNIWQFLIWAVLTEKSIKDARVLLSFCHTSENTVYWSLEVLACSRNCWKNTQARMSNGSKYRKEHVAVFDFIWTNKKSTKNASVRFLFCHTSENTV